MIASVGMWLSLEPEVGILVQSRRPALRIRKKGGYTQTLHKTNSQQRTCACREVARRS